jgi:hypothetical protein
MKFLRSLAADLGDKRLWPIVIVLGVIALAVPIGVAVTTSSPAPKSIAVTPAVPSQPAGTPAPGQALQAIAGPGIPKSIHYTGVERDPFRTAVGAVSTAANAATAAASTSATAVKVATTPTTSSAGGSSSPTPAASKRTTTTTSPVQTVAPTTAVSVPTVPNLTSSESYVVDVAVKDATGTHSYKNIERLSLLPSNGLPALIFLGVLKGGQKAVFLNTGHTVASGSSTCVPSRSDCQLVEMRPGFGLHIKLTDPSLGGQTFDVSVRAIGVERHSSTATARKARKLEYVPGRQLLRLVNASALPSFQYSSGHGYVVENATSAAARARGAAVAKTTPVAILESAIPAL